MADCESISSIRPPPAHLLRRDDAVAPDRRRHRRGHERTFRFADLDTKIAGLEREFCACARQDEEAARLMTIPGIGPIGAMALQAFAPPMESFRRGRDFSALLGLVPGQNTTGGKPRLGRISKMG